jgi:chromosome segregation ATPase
MIDERETDMAQLKQQHSKQLAEFQMELTAVQKQSDSQVNFEEQLNEMERLHNERMQEIVADKNGRIERLSTMLRKLESDLVQVDQLRSALTDRDEKLTQTKQRIDMQQVLVEELRLQLDEKTERLDRYETERAELRSAKADLEEQLASISDHSKNLHKELVAKTETLDRLTGEQSQQCERMSEISRQLGEKDDRINRMRQELQEHSQIMIQLQDQAAQAERNHQLARQEILEMESQLFEFQTQIKANSIELESMREELDENSSRLNRAHADLHERTDEVQRLHTALADMKSDNDREINVLRISIVEKSRELDELRMELLSKDTDISLLQSQLNEPASARGRRRSQRPSSQLRASYSAEDLDKIFSGPSIFDQQSNTGRCLNEAMERFDAELDETIQSIRTNLVSSSKRQSSIDVSQLVDSIQRDLSPLGLRLERDK